MSWPPGTCVKQTLLLVSTIWLAIVAGHAEKDWSHRETRPSDDGQHQQPGRHARLLQQLEESWLDNGGSWPPQFTDLDRALETQRIFRAVAAERNKTAVAIQNIDAAWSNWLQDTNITFNSTSEAAYRKSVFTYNVQRAQQLNQLAGPEVAFGINRFSILTPEEFLARYTGDTQNDQQITVKPDNPQRVSTPASSYLAGLQQTANSTAGNSTNSNSTANSTGAAGNGGSGSTVGPPAATQLFDAGSSSTGISAAPMLPGAVNKLSPVSFATVSNTKARRLQQQQQQQELLQEEAAEELELLQLQEYWQQWRQGPQQEQETSRGFWQQVLTFLGLDIFLISRRSGSSNSVSTLADESTLGDLQGMLPPSSSRRMHQVVLPSASSPFAPPTYCSKQVPFPYGRILPFRSVDWLRGRIVRSVRSMTGNCSNSYAYVAAALAESTMLIQGYNGTAQDISEAQLMECFPGGSCTRGGSVHVLLNYLACNGVAAVGGNQAGIGAYPSAAVDAGKPGECAAGKYHPVRTGIIGWAFVPATELAFGQALSKTPIKVSVDASHLQSYRAGYLGCNVLSSVANHAMLAVGYNYQVRAGPPPPGSRDNFTFFAGPSYWMLKNSWGLQGSVDGFVYVRKGCDRTAPLGMLLNRGVMPTWNQTQSFLVGRLQCANDTNTNQQCSQDLLLRLASYCAGVDDYLPSATVTNCSCSCIPTR